MDPVVLILSYGKLSSMEIVENLLAELNQTKIVTTNTYGSTVLKKLKCDISTKYYKTSISLIPYDGKFETVPTEIQENIEALIIYFDPKDKSFLKELLNINNFVKVNEIKLGFLITASFSGEPNEITFDELREHTDVVFDIVTLKPETDNTDETDDSKIVKYTEIIEGLQNVVWSNVKVKGASNSLRQHSGDSENLENQLNAFENLLITAQSLRCDKRLTRDEVLDKAEQLAEIMSSILNDNDSD